MHHIGGAAALAAAVALGAAGPAQASMEKVRVYERDGLTHIVVQDRGNQAFTYQWVENDPRRHTDDGLALYYRIDRTELPPGVTWEQTEAAVESAVATFRALTCGSVELIRVDDDPGENLGYIQDAVGFGGSPTLLPDITFAGWVPQEFFTAVGLPGSFGVTLPVVPDAADGSPVWGLDVLDPTRELTDINGDRKHDLVATEVYFNRDWNYVTDDEDLANTLFYIDVESIVLHELGHALGMDHFGRYEVVLDQDGNFVDLILNPHSLSTMNTSNYLQKRDLSGSDVASFCGLYANWGAGKPLP
jgi:hypothetical protein